TIENKTKKGGIMAEERCRATGPVSIVRFPSVLVSLIYSYQDQYDHIALSTTCVFMQRVGKHPTSSPATVVIPGPRCRFEESSVTRMRPTTLYVWKIDILWTTAFASSLRDLRLTHDDGPFNCWELERLTSLEAFT